MLMTGISPIIEQLAPDSMTYQNLQTIFTKATKENPNISALEFNKTLALHLSLENPSIISDSTQCSIFTTLFGNVPHYNPIPHHIYMSKPTIDTRRDELTHTYQFRTRSARDNIVHYYYTGINTTADVIRKSYTDTSFMKRYNVGVDFVDAFDSRMYNVSMTVEQEAHQILEPHFEEITGGKEFNCPQRRAAYIKDHTTKSQYVKRLMYDRGRYAEPDVDYQPFFQYIVDELASLNPQQFFDVTYSLGSARMTTDMIIDNLDPYLTLMDDTHPYKVRVNDFMIRERYVHSQIASINAKPPTCNHDRLHTLNEFAAIQNRMVCDHPLNPLLHERYQDTGAEIAKEYVNQVLPHHWCPEHAYNEFCNHLFTGEYAEVYQGLGR